MTSEGGRRVCMVELVGNECPDRGRDGDRDGDRDGGRERALWEGRERERMVSYAGKKIACTHVGAVNVC